MQKDSVLNDITSLLSFQGIGKTLNEYKIKIDNIINVK